MNMKRMFSKKKKTNKSAVYNSETMATIDEVTADNDIQNHQKFDSKKKSRNRKKRKGKHQKGPNGTKEPEKSSQGGPKIAYHSQDGTKVTIQSGGFGNDQMVPNDVIERNHKSDEKRIPGSESSSRTASSASSSSQTRPGRRPWSLIDSSHGQSLTDLTDERTFARDFLPPDHHNMTAPTICTLPRGMELEDYGKNHRNRTFTLDFSFFRRFKRSSINFGSSSNKRLSASQIILPQETKERESFSIKSVKKNRRSKKQKNNESPTQNATPPLMDDTQESSKRRSMLSGSESLLPVQESTLEEALTPCGSPHEVDPFCSETSGSRTSLSTVIATSDVISQHSQSISNDTDVTSLENEVVRRRRASSGVSRCEKCQRHLPGSRRSACYCFSRDTASTKQLRTRTVKSQTELDVLAPLSATVVNGRLTYSLIDFDQDPFLATTSTPKSKMGGSVKDLSSGRKKLSLKHSKTTPDHQHTSQESSFHIASPKGSVPYASSPQVNLPKVEVVDVPIERPKASSVKIKFRDEKPKLLNIAGALSELHLASNNAPVDSPIRRAIAYPGVVMRRNHPRQQKPKTDSAIVQSSSCGMLSRDERAKHVMSLNVEDLPTYERSRDDARWRSSTSNERDRSYGRGSVIDIWSQDQFINKKCANHYTSAGDLRNLRCLQGHSIEDIINMDDDEFLDYYLSSQVSTSPGHDSKFHHQDGSSKRVKNLRKSVQSFANLISPGKPGKKPQRSSSFKESSGPVVKPHRPGHNNSGGSSGAGVQLASYCPPGKRGKRANTKNRRSKLWCETFDHSGLGDGELKRQEAIFELYQGERIMVDDLKMAKKTYRDSMVTLKMLTEDEVTKIFGKLDCLLPLHEDLLARLEKTRTKDGKTDGVGHVFIDWIPTLTPYDEYCANQADAKETLDAVVSREDRVRDFLQRCLESPFSRKLDLWSYLDLPRSRLVKYPLLLRAIHKVTPPDHKDWPLLAEAIDVIIDTISRVDELTGERQAKFVKSKLEYLDDKKRSFAVDSSRKIICSGQLKPNRGPKLQVFLFDHVLVLTRNATRDNQLTYQVFRQPLPLKTLVVDTEEGGKLSGSFRGGLLSGDKAKYSFRVKSLELNVTHTLIATDEHDKKQWVNALQEAINNCQRKNDACSALHTPIAPRRGSSQKVKSSDSKKESASVKRTASVKSDSGGSSLFSRGRSVTLSGLPSRRNSKEKKELKDNLKKSKTSPSSSRRGSKPTLFETLTGGVDSSHNKLTVEDKSDWQRSRSLTSSPIAFLAHFPRRSSRSSGSGLTRSESCYSKPPKGRVSQFVRQYSTKSRSGGTPPRSPSISGTRSIPDLSSYERKRSNSEHALTLEAVRNRLVMMESCSSTTRSESLAEETLTISQHFQDRAASVSTSPTESHSSINFPSSRNSSCQCGSTKTSSTSSYKSTNTNTMQSSISSPNLLQSGPVPTIAWAPPTDEDSSGSANERNSSCSSSSSLEDVPSAMDDVEVILDNVSHIHTTEDDFCTSNNVTNVKSDVAATLNNILDRICDESPQPTVARKPTPPLLTVTCNADYITITSDDGLAWPGKDIEMAV